MFVFNYQQTLTTQAPASPGVKLLSVNPLRKVVLAQQAAAALKLGGAHNSPLDDVTDVAPHFRTLRVDTSGDSDILVPFPPAHPPPADVISANPLMRHHADDDSKLQDAPDFKALPISPSALHKDIIKANPILAGRSVGAGGTTPRLQRRSSVKVLAETKSGMQLQNIMRSPDMQLSFPMWLRTGTLMKVRHCFFVNLN